jgi:hypothetical protein
MGDVVGKSCAVTQDPFLVDQKSASWNHLHVWLMQLDALRLVA